MSKIMVTLYYTSSKAARLDCDFLGINRRRVTNLVRPYDVERYSRESGHWHKILSEDGEELKKEPITTILKVDDALLREKLVDYSEAYATAEELEEKQGHAEGVIYPTFPMNYIDDESYW